MKINLQTTVSFSDGFTKNRQQLRAYMRDIYPDVEIRAINILLNVYESGIAKQLSQMEKIPSTQYSSFVSKLEYDYGMTTESAIEALNAWIDVCIRKGAGTRYGNAIIKAKKATQEAVAVPVESAVSPKVSLGLNDTIYEDKNITVKFLKWERVRYLNTGNARVATFLFVNKTDRKVSIYFKNISIDGFLNQEKSLSYELPEKQKGMKNFNLVYEDKVPGRTDDFDTVEFVVTYGMVKDGYTSLIDGKPIESDIISLKL